MIINRWKPFNIQNVPRFDVLETSELIKTEQDEFSITRNGASLVLSWKIPLVNPNGICIFDDSGFEFFCKKFCVLGYLATDFPFDPFNTNGVGHIYGGDKLLVGRMKKWFPLFNPSEQELETLYDLIAVEEARDYSIRYSSLYSRLRMGSYVNKSISEWRESEFPNSKGNEDFKNAVYGLKTVRDCQEHKHDRSSSCSLFGSANADSSVEWCGLEKLKKPPAGLKGKNVLACQNNIFKLAKEAASQKKMSIASGPAVIALVRLLVRFDALKKFNLWDADKDTLEYEFQQRFFVDPRPVCYQK